MKKPKTTSGDELFSVEQTSVHHRNRVRIFQILLTLTMLVVIDLTSICFAFFSDWTNQASNMKSGHICAQATLKIDGQIGDNIAQPGWQSNETCVAARYTQVEYLQFDGNSWIDTGINQIGDTRARIDFQFGSSLPARNYAVFNAGGAGSAQSYSVMTSSALPFTWRIDYGGVTSYPTLSNPTARMVAELNNKQFSINGTTLLTSTGVTPTIASPIYLGSAGNSAWALIGNVYSFSIKKNGVTAINLVPVIDNKTGECGMWDSVGRKFFGNDGPGDFSCPRPTGIPNCDNLLCNGHDQGSTGVLVSPNTIHEFSYTLENTGTVDYQNYTGDTISAWLDIPYSPVEYITFDGSSYIDSGIRQTGSVAIDVDFKFTDPHLTTASPVYNGTVFGARQAANQSQLFFNYSSNNANFLMQYATTSQTLGTKSTNRCQLSVHTGGTATITGCGTPASRTITTVANNPLNIFIGGLNQAGSPVAGQGFIGNIYSFSISGTDSSGVAASRDFVPVVDNKTGECGLFDKITKRFFDNLGGGKITCPAPAVPIFYASVDYLQFTGTQYINTGVDNSGYLTTSVTYKFDNLAVDNFAFGVGNAASSANSLMLMNYGAASRTYGYYNGGASSLQNSDSNIHTVKFDNNSASTPLWTYDGTLTGYITSTTVSSGNARTIYLGATNDSGTARGMQGKIYAFSLTKSGVQLDMVPVVNTSTGACGMYDRVSGQFFGNAGTGTITCPVLTGGGIITSSTNSLHMLLYPESVSNTTINSELAAMQAGTAITSPSAIASLDGPCLYTGMFYGIDIGIPSCTTSMLTDTQYEEYSVGERKTHKYKFVLFAPSSISAIYSNTLINLGLSSSAQGIMAANWKQQLHPYVSASAPIGNSPNLTIGNTQPFLDQVIADSAIPNVSKNEVRLTDYLHGLITATDIEDGPCVLGGVTGCRITIFDYGGFDPSVVGKYYISYEVVDSDGNIIDDILTVEVWNFVKLVTGQYHSLILGSNGSVWGVGANSNGQLGIGTTSNALLPVQISQSYFYDLPVIDITTGDNVSCALNSAGKAYCWGDRTASAMGNGGSNSGNQTTPIPVSMPSGITFTQISGPRSTSANASFAGLGSDGNIYVWGNGNNYRLGTGSTSDQSTPVKITTTGDFIFVDQGNMGGGAINTAGELYIWGYNNHGQLALGNTTTTGSYMQTNSTPHKVFIDVAQTIPLTGVSSISYGGYGTYGFVIALLSNGDVYAWGWSYGVNGNSPTTDVLLPQKINLSGVRQISAAVDFAHYVVGNDIYTIGYANYGEAFMGNTTIQTTPAKSIMSGIAGNVGQAASGYDNSFILSADGKTVWGIGYGGAGQLGRNSTANSTNAAVPWIFTPNPAP